MGLKDLLKRKKKPGKNVTNSSAYKQQSRERKQTAKNPGETGGFRYGKSEVQRDVSKLQQTTNASINKSPRAKNEAQVKALVKKTFPKDRNIRVVTKKPSSLASIDNPSIKKQGKNMPKQRPLELTKRKKKKW